MDAKAWFKENKSKKVRALLAKEAGTTIGYLNQLSSTEKKAGPEMCRKLYEASKKVTPETVILPHVQRPDIAEIFNQALIGGRAVA